VRDATAKLSLPERLVAYGPSTAIPRVGCCCYLLTGFCIWCTVARPGAAGAAASRHGFVADPGRVAGPGRPGASDPGRVAGFVATPAAVIEPASAARVDPTRTNRAVASACRTGFFVGASPTRMAASARRRGWG
jgi:hypothetical protein